MQQGTRRGQTLPGGSGGVMSIIARNNVTVRGVGERARVFAHGFGCDQNMWRHVTPAFEQEYKVVLFDHVGVRQVGSSRL